MKLVSKIWQTDMNSDGGPEQIGEIWTDGMKVYFSPKSNKDVAVMASATIIGSDYSVLTPRDPVKFVKALYINYRMITVASPAVEVD